MQLIGKFKIPVHDASGIYVAKNMPRITHSNYENLKE